ncbi:alpha/beta hydrolase family protein [Ceratobasidium sp. AG-Ba]|nr:alpha/beta hydrolase family protein [Ceratobasidium sp. AG-Ba]QRW09059.1 alpha/beta hydrolase family protein [Ceratobasidium sp. AG-Ba]
MSLSQILRGLRLRLIAYFLRSSHAITAFFRRIIGTPPHFTRFAPNRSFSIASNTSSRRVKINVFEPEGFDRGKKYPVYMNFHGSGFVIPSLGTDADFCRFVSNQTGAVVLDCDYAKAPEWPFPAAPDDVKDIIDHVIQNREGYFDTSRLAIGGFSAGGNLALTSGMNQAPGTLKAAIAFYPPTDLTQGAKRAQPEGDSSSLTAWRTQFFDDSYIPPDMDKSDPRLSPNYAPIASFPEHVFITICGNDCLQYEALALADRLEKGGIKLVRRFIPGVGHAWDKEAQGGTLGGQAKHDAYVAAVEVLKTAFKSQ